MQHRVVLDLIRLSLTDPEQAFNLSQTDHPICVRRQ